MPVAVKKVPEFEEWPKGVIPASKSGVYREDHYDHRGDVYTVSSQMQIQQPRTHDMPAVRDQQMNQQRQL